MKKKLFALLLAVTLVVPSVNVTASEANNDITELSVSVNSVSENNALTVEESGVAVVEEESKLSVCAEEIVSEATTSSTYPSSYDPRDIGMVSGTRLQVGGTCWVYAAVAAMECNLIKKGLADNTIDLSEAHIRYFMDKKFEDPRGYYTDDLTDSETPLYERMNRSGMEWSYYRK